jgi:hypothetical protein
MEQEKQISISTKLLQRIVFDYMLIGLYLSFVIFTAIEFINSGDIYRSLSGLGWRAGELGRLAFYIFFTIGFFIYQMRLFTKLSGRKHLVINWVMIIGSVFLLAGSCCPLGTGGNALDIVHVIFCQSGAVFMLGAIGLMVIAYCRETATLRSTKAKVYIPYFFMVVLCIAGFLTGGVPGVISSAMYSMMATFMAMIYFQYLTVCFELAPRK